MGKLIIVPRMLCAIYYDSGSGAVSFLISIIYHQWISNMHLPIGVLRNV